MRGVEFEISIYTEEDLKLKDLNIEIESKLTAWEKRVFWNIDYAYISMEDKNYTSFSSGGELFVCNIKYEDFKRLIQNNL